MFHNILWVFDWIIPPFRLRHLAHKRPKDLVNKISGTPFELGSWYLAYRSLCPRCTWPDSSHLSPLTLEVVGAPQMTLQQYLSILPCLPLPSRNLQTPFSSIPWCYLPISSSVFLSFLLLSLSLAELSSPCQRILRCGHTIWVSLSLPLDCRPKMTLLPPPREFCRHSLS